jgi:membrane protein
VSARLWRVVRRLLTTDWIEFGRELVTFAAFATSRFINDRCPQAAAALTYTSLLSLVPLTTITIGIVSAFPAFQELQVGFREIIFDNLVPQVGAAVLDNLQGFAANAGRLTGFGIVGLIVTAILLLSTIEGAFNGIWRVNENRPLLVRLLSFWAILTLTPILTVTSLSITTQFLRGGIGAAAIGPFLQILPTLLEFVGFMALYWLIPNRSVRAVDAAIGAGFAAILFEIAKAGFVVYLTAVPFYQTVYGAIAVIPIFLLWLYVAWSIVLAGAVIAASLPDWRAGKILGGDVEKLLPAQRLVMACAVLRVLLGASRLGTRIRRRTLLSRVPIGGAMLDGILDQLRHARFVERGQNDGWILSRDLGTATLYDLARSLGVGLRGASGTVRSLAGERWEQEVMSLLQDADRAHQQIMGVPLLRLLDPGPASELPELRRDFG